MRQRLGGFEKENKLRYYKFITMQNIQHELSKFTTGRRNEGMPPGGNLKSLIKFVEDLSLYPPFARWELVLEETLELPILPFPTALEGSKFMLATFLIFFS